MKLARGLLLAAIRAYKRHVSPRKGFARAYRVHLGACSGSTPGLRAISRTGAGMPHPRECPRVARALPDEPPPAT